MNTRAVMDVSGLSNYAHGPSGSLWWGMLGIITIEGTVFGSLVSTYFYLRLDKPVWPPAGTEPPELTVPVIYTSFLIASSFVLAWGERGIAQGKGRRLFFGQVGAILLALIFLSLKAWEYSTEVTYRWDTHSYGSIVWIITGFHAAHVISVVMKTCVLALLSFRGYFTAERRLGVEVNGLYWHFVVGVWIPLFGVLYIVPRLI